MTESRLIVEIVSKPWGFEKIIINTDQYCGKLLYIVKGKNTSMHYHKTKDETFFVHSGKLKMFYNDNIKEVKEHTVSLGDGGLYNNMHTVTLNPGDNFRVLPGRVHQIFALEDTQLYEFSTMYDETDTVRFGGV